MRMLLRVVCALIVACAFVAAQGDAHAQAQHVASEKIDSLKERAFAEISLPALGQTCSVGDGRSGTCVDTKAVACTTGVVTGKCAGAANIKCCPSTSAPAPAPAASSSLNGPACTGRAGICVDTAACSAHGGTYAAGFCPKFANNIKCCTLPATAATRPAATTNTAAPAAPAVAAPNGCKLPSGAKGLCVKTSACVAAQGTTYTNLCKSDPADVKCCIGNKKLLPGQTSLPAPSSSVSTVRLTAAQATGRACKAFGSAGTCKPNVQCTTGVAFAGFCPGPANIQCCVPNAVPKPGAVRPGKYTGKALNTIYRSAAERKAEAEHRTKFLTFRTKFKRTYGDSASAYATFKANRNAIIDLNDKAAKRKAIFSSQTKFADMSPSVFRNRYLNFNMHQQITSFLETVHEEWIPSADALIEQGPVAPTSIDASGALLGGSLEVDFRNLLSPMKNQQQCGSCYAFASISALESQVTRFTGTHPIYSPQQVVDCTTGTGNLGCNGGFPQKTFDWYQTNRVCTEASYPYAAAPSGQCLHQGECSGPMTDGAVRYTSCYPNYYPTCNSTAQIPPTVAALKENGPYTVVVDASNWQFYQGGIFPASNCKTGWMDMNHAVQLVGYGEENGTKFFVVRNSWSDSWGEQGFIRIEAANGACGIPNVGIGVKLKQADIDAITLAAANSAPPTPGV